MNSRGNPSYPDDFILVITTTNSIEEAKTLADLIVGGGYAACVSISSPVLSVYTWHNKIEHEDEFMLFIKTHRHCYSPLEALIRQNHSYDVPEIMALPICEIEQSYASWVLQNSERCETDR